ncbi:hypothetical protein KEJ45_04825 [Candidatus Bathyarchaeota archaeon]|nr:hypothetical protein [Candidatus Bathyarchaeota archaeon]
MEGESEKPSFSAYEYAKMCSLTADAIKKVTKVLERLQKAGNHKDAMLLLQALDNLNRVNMKLQTLGRVKARRQAEKTLEKARQILGEK